MIEKITSYLAGDWLFLKVVGKQWLVLSEHTTSTSFITGTGFEKVQAAKPILSVSGAGNKTTMTYC